MIRHNNGMGMTHAPFALFGKTKELLFHQGKPEIPRAGIQTIL